MARPVAVTLLGLSTLWAGVAMAKTYTLSISGDPGARYDGACTVMTGSGDERIALAGAVPLDQRFDGDGLSCRLRVEGRVAVEIVHDGGRARSASQGRVARSASEGGVARSASEGGTIAVSAR